MVNLPELSARDIREDDSERLRRFRSHRTWGARFGRSREVEKQRGEPTRLRQLERLAYRSVRLMERHGTITPHSYFVAMDLLRQQYNLNFIVICEKCGGIHLHDELTAPER